MFKRRTGNGAADNAAEAWRTGVSAGAEALAGRALRHVQNEAGVRVEDYLTVLASMVGEAALAASGVIDIHDHDLTPGSAVFGDAINAVLTGDVVEIGDLPADSVLGLFTDGLVPTVIPATAIGSVRTRYERVATGVGTVPWGSVALSVGDDNAPWVLPIQVAYEMRPAVDELCASLDIPAPKRHVPCVLALCVALRQVAQAIDPGLGAALSLDVVFGMAKMAPMTKRALDAAASADA